LDRPLAQELFGGGNGLGRVMREQRRHLKRHPSIHTVCAVMNRPEEVSGPAEIVER